MKADLEALIDVAADWSARVHVRLNSHQEDGIEAFRLPVGCVDLHVLDGRSKGHCPGGVEHKECRRPVRVPKAAAGRVCSHKPAGQRSMRMILSGWAGDQSTGSRCEVVIGSGGVDTPLPLALELGRSEPDSV